MMKGVIMGCVIS
jgi:hypothetical protein